MFESHGPSLKKAREKREFHISIVAGENATADNPSWLVTHHDAEKDDSPVEEHKFQDGQKMLRHVASAVGVPNQEGGE